MIPIPSETPEDKHRAAQRAFTHALAASDYFPREDPDAVAPDPTSTAGKIASEWGLGPSDAAALYGTETEMLAQAKRLAGAAPDASPEDPRRLRPNPLQGRTGPESQPQSTGEIFADWMRSNMGGGW